MQGRTHLGLENIEIKESKKKCKKKGEKIITRSPHFVAKVAAPIGESKIEPKEVLLSLRLQIMILFNLPTCLYPICCVILCMIHMTTLDKGNVQARYISKVSKNAKVCV